MGTLKILGLGLIAALTLSALVSPAASANTATFTGSSATLGHDTSGANNALTVGVGVECEEATYDGELVDAFTLEATPMLGECALSSGAPATATHNGCSFRITLGTSSGSHSASATTALVCPGSNQLVTHFYFDEGHTKDACTIEVPSQANLGQLTVTDQTNGHIRIAGTIPSVVNYLVGSCTGGPTMQFPNAPLHVDVTFTGGIGIH